MTVAVIPMTTVKNDCGDAVMVKAMRPVKSWPRSGLVAMVGAGHAEVVSDPIA